MLEAANSARPLGNWVAGWIGLLVAGLVAYEAPVSMAVLKPARDLGPRLWALLAGWGPIAFPGPRGGFRIPNVATIVGALIGGALYHFVYKHFYSVPAETKERKPEAAGGVACAGIIAPV